MEKRTLTDCFAGFSKLDREARLRALFESGALQPGDAEYLLGGGLPDAALAEHFIENAIGYFQLPLGVATNFRIDGVDRMIPFAVEETSIIAAASKTARWVREHGTIATAIRGDGVIGQIQCARIASWEDFRARVDAAAPELVRLGNEGPAASLARRGGGLRGIVTRRLVRPDGGTMAVVHVVLDPSEAMGANVVNQVCEFLKPHVERCTGETVTMCILSNLADTKLARAEIRMRDVDASLARRIEEASLFAELDPYRAATSNKGVLNGVDAVLIATGNDWRAVEAGVHAHAARDGQYRSITRWRVEDGDLVGTIEAPLIVGTVGGVTTLHPTAAMCLRMLGSPSANGLARIVAAVGLVQNLGALRALTTVGIVEGHMKLHARNLSLGAGARPEELPQLQRMLEEALKTEKRLSQSTASRMLLELRQAQGSLP